MYQMAADQPPELALSNCLTTVLQPRIDAVMQQPQHQHQQGQGENMPAQGRISSFHGAP